MCSTIQIYMSVISIIRQDRNKKVQPTHVPAIMGTEILEKWECDSPFYRLDFVGQASSSSWWRTLNHSLDGEEQCQDVLIVRYVVHTMLIQTGSTCYCIALQSVDCVDERRSQRTRQEMAFDQCRILLVAVVYG